MTCHFATARRSALPVLFPSCAWKAIHSLTGSCVACLVASQLVPRLTGHGYQHFSRSLRSHYSHISPLAASRANYSAYSFAALHRAFPSASLPPSSPPTVTSLTSLLPIISSISSCLVAEQPGIQGLRCLSARLRRAAASTFIASLLRCVTMSISSSRPARRHS